MTATNMCSNFGSKWDSPPNQQFNRNEQAWGEGEEDT